MNKTFKELGFKAGDTVRCVKSLLGFYTAGTHYLLTQGECGPVTIERLNGASADWELVTNEIDYRDGEWHRWNGGECPVNPKDKVRYEMRGDVDAVSTCPAEILRWNHHDTLGDIIFFRVVEKYEEPVKVVHWANDYPTGIGGWYSTREDGDKVGKDTRIAVIRREMIDGKVVGYFMEEV